MSSSFVLWHHRKVFSEVLGFYCRHEFGGRGWVAGVGLVVWFYVAGMGLVVGVELPVSGSLSLTRTCTSYDIVVMHLSYHGRGYGRGASELPWLWVSILIGFLFYFLFMGMKMLWIWGFLYLICGYEKVMELVFFYLIHGYEKLMEMGDSELNFFVFDLQAWVEDLWLICEYVLKIYGWFVSMVEDLYLICGGCCDCRGFEGLPAWAIDLGHGLPTWVWWLLVNLPVFGVYGKIW